MGAHMILVQVVLFITAGASLFGLAIYLLGDQITSRR